MVEGYYTFELKDTKGGDLRLEAHGDHIAIRAAADSGELMLIVIDNEDFQTIAEKWLSMQEETDA